MFLGEFCSLHSVLRTVPLRDPSALSGARTTTVASVARKTSVRLLKDDFNKSSVPNRDLEYLWTGRATFPLRLPSTSATSSGSFSSSVTAATSASMSSPVACAASKQLEELDPVEFPHYGGDEFPGHWPDAQRPSATTRPFQRNSTRAVLDE